VFIQRRIPVERPAVGEWARARGLASSETAPAVPILVRGGGGAGMGGDAEERGEKKVVGACWFGWDSFPPWQDPRRFKRRS
jgi:hypothetical protein